MRTSRWVLISYTLIIVAGIVAALPNLFTQAQLAALLDSESYEKQIS